MGLLGFFIDVTGRIVKPYYCPMIVSPEMDTAPCGLKACLLDQSYKRMAGSAQTYVRSRH
jgi:hypothetical protein